MSPRAQQSPGQTSEHRVPARRRASSWRQPVAADGAETARIARMRDTWTTGDFDHIARGYAPGASEFVATLDLARGERVLDVACGTGNLTLPAARRGARVTGIDIAPNLLSTTRRLADAEGLDVDLDEGNAEALPYGDGTFDTAISMFGIMFASRPDRAGAELLRVLRPGGRFALACWGPDGFVGQMLRLHVARVPAPAGASSPVWWGDEQRVGAYLPGATVRCERRIIEFHYPVAPAQVNELFVTYYGPTARVAAALGPEERRAFIADLEAHWRAHNVATDGTTRVRAEYLAVTGTAA